VIVGVNKYATDHSPITIWKMDPEIERRQLKRLREVKETRNVRNVKERLGKLRRAAEGDGNLMPFIIDAVREYATLQEICDVFRDVFGTYTDPGML
jgi:methylmalonyl-CoA mutase N-terminal domain/subunit